MHNPKFFPIGYAEQRPVGGDLIKLIHNMKNEKSSERHKSKGIAVALIALFSMLVASSAVIAIIADEAYGDTHPLTEIDIAPGMTYTWTPIWTVEGVTITVTSETLNGNPVEYAEILSGDTIKVTMDPNTKSGDVYHIMIKGSVDNPLREYFIPIKFSIVGNLSVSVSKHPAIVQGSSVTLSPMVSGMYDSLTWSFTQGKPTHGLLIDSATGKVTGTPSGLGTITVYITVTSDLGETAELETSIDIVPQLGITNDPKAGAIAYVLS